MARIYRGILGGIEGRVGDVEGYYYKGVPVIRAKKRIVKREITSEPKLAALARMKAANAFLRNMTDFVNLGFRFTETGMRSNGYNAAKSYLIKNCFDGVYPNQELNYSKVILTQGDLLAALNPQIEATAEGIKFTWETDSNWAPLEKRSQVMLLVYSPALKRTEYMCSGARRWEGQEILKVREDFKGHTIHCYISFVSDDRDCVATSTYIGAIEISLF